MFPRVMDVAQSLDEVIMAMVSMGFELEDCQEAIQEGKLSVHSAIEWILAGKPKAKSESQVLHLGQPSSRANAVIGSNPFVNPQPIAVSQAGPIRDSGPPSNPEDEPLKTRLIVSDDQRERKLKFEEKQRLEAQQKAKEEKLAKKKEKDEVLKHIQEDRSTAKLKLNSGAKVSPGQTSNASSSSNTEDATSKPDSVQPATASEVDDNSLTTIQVRLPTGNRVVRHKFPASSPLQDVWTFLMTQNIKDLQEYILIQPFPRLEFVDLTQSLRDLGLTPTGSLVLNRAHHLDSKKPKISDDNNEHNISINPSSPPLATHPTFGPAPGPSRPAPGPNAPVSVPGVGRSDDPGSLGSAPNSKGPTPTSTGPTPNSAGPAPNSAGPAPGAPRHAPGHVRFGPGPLGPAPGPLGPAPGPLGPALGPLGPAPGLLGPAPEEDDDILDAIADQLDEEEEHLLPGYHPMAPGVGGAMPGRGGAMPWWAGAPPGRGGGMPGRGGANLGPMLGLGGPGAFGGQVPHHVWGRGQSLGLQPWDDPQQLPHHQHDPKQLAVEAARRRYDQAPPAAPVALACVPVVCQEVPRLLTLVLSHVCHRLTDPRRQAPASMNGLPNDVASQVIDFLVKNDMLTAKQLRAFSSCRLTKLLLSGYKYATNELLQEIKFHTFLVHLNLAACPLITDVGLLHALQGLKRLKVLRLSDNKHVTNNVLPALQGLRQLTQLMLDSTSVSDVGLLEFCRSCLPRLVYLDLSHTAVTHALLPALAQITTLEVLLLEDTKVMSLAGIQRVKSLRVLDLGSTGIFTDSILCLQGLDKLLALNLSNTRNINGDTALLFLADLKLETLQLTSRLTTGDEGLQNLVAMPLQVLDLTNYNLITDLSLSFVGKITSLRKLRLCNTKVTDEGLQQLKDLTSLEELMLDRVAVTDDGAAVISNFVCLDELSLSETLITDDFLASQVLSNCVLLKKLNLSRTNITDKGIVLLKLPLLSILNVDETFLNDDVCDYLRSGTSNLPSLDKLVYRNLRSPPIADQPGH